MNATAAPETLPVKLHCLGGREPPMEIASDFLGLQKLPQSARDGIWGALVHCLGDKVEEGSQAALDRFCASHGTSQGALAPALKAARFFVRQAAARDLSAAVFAEDVMGLTENDEALARSLAGGYEGARNVLRAELMRQALADHGKLLERVDWRTDILASSSRGERFRMPYVTLTFSYREGEQQSRVSLQMPRETISQLRALCDTILA